MFGEKYTNSIMVSISWQKIITSWVNSRGKILGAHIKSLGDKMSLPPVTFQGENFLLEAKSQRSFQNGYLYIGLMTSSNCSCYCRWWRHHPDPDSIPTLSKKIKKNFVIGCTCTWARWRHQIAPSSDPVPTVPDPAPHCLKICWIYIERFIRKRGKQTQTRITIHG